MVCTIRQLFAQTYISPVEAVRRRGGIEITTRCVATAAGSSIFLEDSRIYLFIVTLISFPKFHPIDMILVHARSSSQHGRISQPTGNREYTYMLFEVRRMRVHVSATQPRLHQRIPYRLSEAGR